MSNSAPLKEIIDAYLAGKTTTALASIYGVSAWQISKSLRAKGVTMRHRGRMAFNLAGRRIGRLIPERRDPEHPNKWICLCDCGTRKSIYTCGLLQRTRSCGCLKKEHPNGLEHGHTRGGRPSGEWRSWNGARQRCTNPNGQGYERYGGRGIRMCKEWSDSFEAFLRDMGPKPPGTSLDRINNDGHYEPGNCRWATPTEQNSNQRVNRFVEIDGEKVTIAEASRRLGIKGTALYHRLSKGDGLPEKR